MAGVVGVVTVAGVVTALGDHRAGAGGGGWGGAGAIAPRDTGVRAGADCNIRRSTAGFLSLSLRPPPRVAQVGRDSPARIASRSSASVVAAAPWPPRTRSPRTILTRSSMRLSLPARSSNATSLYEPRRSQRVTRTVECPLDHAVPGRSSSSATCGRPWSVRRDCGTEEPLGRICLNRILSR